LGHGIKITSGAHPLVLLHLLDAAGDGVEVGEHPAEPTLVDEWHPALDRISSDRVLGLLLGADKENGAVVGNQVSDERVGDVDPLERLVEIDDVDTVALAKDESLHLRVPAPGLMTEVNPGLQQLPHGDDSHFKLLPSGW